MKKTLINILIIFVISTLNSIEKNEHIELPKIPIYIEGNYYSSFKHPYFKEVTLQDQALFNIQIMKKKSYKGASLRTRIFITLLGIAAGGYTGYLIKDNNENENKDISATAASILGAYVIGGAVAFGFAPTLGREEEEDSAMRKTDYAFYRNFQNNKNIICKFTKKKPGKSYSMPNCVYGVAGIYVMGIGPAYGFATGLFPAESDIVIPLDSNDLGIMLSKIKIAGNDYINLKEKVNIYNQPFIKSAHSVEEKNELKKLFNPKSEFETNQKYESRIAQEAIIKKEILATYEQRINIEKEQEEIRKFKLLKEIKEEINNIKFTKSYNFQVSNYDADKQSFSFNISGTKKKVVVPLMRAPRFKENISDYVVQEIYKPTLNGTWEKVSDDYVLINAKTNEIINWEGSIPTYVETAVENPPILSASVKLIEPSGEGYLDAEETAMIQVTLTNSGKGSAKRTRISLFQQEGTTLYYDVSKTIEEIKPDQSIISEFAISVPANISDDIVDFKISFIEEQGFEPSPLNFTAETRAMLKPDLQVVDFGVDDANGDGKISKVETADITLRLQNIGQGKAKQVSVSITENVIENVFIISENQFEIGDLESGESKDVLFTVSTNNRVNETVKLAVNISEKRPQFSIEDSIILEIEKTLKQLAPIVFKGSDEKENIIFADDFSIDIEQDVPQCSIKNENRLAIIFGIEDYKNVSDVSFAHRDASVMKEYFINTLGIKENKIYYKTNEDVGKAEFHKVFSKDGWLDKRVQAGKTEIYFFYAGHGAPDIKESKAYLIPYDGDPNYASLTGYELEQIYDNLAGLKAKSVTVFLDACFTGANRENEMLLADARPLMIEVESPIANGITVFSATGQKEISSAWPEKKHGLFSYYLMKGMQGEADVNNDKKLSIRELSEYVHDKVSEQAGYLDREQTPQMISDNENRILINY